MATDQLTDTWWTDFFDERYRLADLDRQPEEVTRAQVDCAVGALGLHPGERVLDLACGTGRHTVALAERGMRVTGVDLNADYLRLAERRARDRGVAPALVRADMRDLSSLGDGSFDAVVSLYTSFGFFPEPADNVAVLREVCRVLACDGRLLLDVINRDWLLRTFAASDFAPRDGRLVIRDFDDGDAGIVLHEDAFDPLTSTLTWTIRRLAPPAGSVVAPYRVYSLHELCVLLSEAGLEHRATLGAYDGSPFDVFSPRIIAVAAAP